MGTSYENGSLFNLSLNRKVEIEGSFDETGTLVADTVEFERVAELYPEEELEPSVLRSYLSRFFDLRDPNAWDDDEDDDDRRPWWRSLLN